VIWVFVVVVVGLIAVLAELLLSYQKRAHDLRLKQEPLRRHIRAHAKAMQDAVAGIQGIATEQVAEYTTELQGLARRADELREALRVLERQVLGDTASPARHGNLIEDGDAEAGKVDEEETVEDKVGQAQDFLRQEVDGHRLSLQRDVEVVRRTLALLESKLRRSPAANANGKSQAP
jgi:hypothetical protein